MVEAQRFNQLRGISIEPLPARNRTHCLKTASHVDNARPALLRAKKSIRDGSGQQIAKLDQPEEWARRNRLASEKLIQL